MCFFLLFLKPSYFDVFTATNPRLYPLFLAFSTHEIAGRKLFLNFNLQWPLTKSVTILKYVFTFQNTFSPTSSTLYRHWLPVFSLSHDKKRGYLSFSVSLVPQPTLSEQDSLSVHTYETTHLAAAASNHVSFYIHAYILPTCCNAATDRQTDTQTSALTYTYLLAKSSS